MTFLEWGRNGAAARGWRIAFGARGRRRRLRGLSFTTVLLLSLLPAWLVSAQETLRPKDEVSPATRHAQVIADGVMTAPAPEMAWRVGVGRAADSTRATAEERAPGFVLADESLIAITDAEGRVLRRLAPGEAAWTGDGEPVALANLGERGGGYYELSLAPASAAVEGRGMRRVTLGAPFPAPSGDAFDVDLIRDVLNRNEESVIPAGQAPLLLLVTAGMVFVQPESGDISQLEAGRFLEVAGSVVVTGASRAPAAFVAARVGASVPERLPLKGQGEALATPVATPLASPSLAATPAATPVGSEASLTIEIYACPAGMTPDEFDSGACAAGPPGVTLALVDPASDAPLDVSEASPEVWRWASLEARPYALDVTALPQGFADSTLDDQPCCESEHDFMVAPGLGSNQAHALYLFRPPGVAGDVDSDDDGLTDARETALGTDPFAADTDGDTLSDGDEVEFYGTDPLRRDTDGDGLDDAQELVSTGTNPLAADSDGDGVSDPVEIAAGSDPVDAASVPAPSPRPGTPAPSPSATPAPSASPLATPAALPTPTREPAVLPTASPAGGETPKPSHGAEASPGPSRREHPGEALDGDGLSTLDEIAVYGTDPLKADTDGDGVNDGDEVAAGTDPRDPANH